MRLLVAVLVALMIGNLANGQEPNQVLTLPGSKKVSDPASYGIGYDIGRNISQGGLSADDVNANDLLAGIMDALAGKDLAVKPQAIQQAMQTLQGKVQARMQQKSKTSLAEAEKFLEQNKKRDGVQVTDSGLQYEVVKSGSGASPTMKSTVTVHYEGKLVDGTIFDSSLQRGEPTSFQVGRVIPGWTEALLRMKVGDKWKLYIPPDLAYGEQGAGPDIGPNATLIFDVELLEVK